MTELAAPVLAGLLPPEVAAAEAFADPAGPPELFPEEERLVARAVEVRRREFGTVRSLARSALARLGGPRVPLLPGERGAPSWPDGFTGSMTHCHGYRAAAVARTTDLAVVGIDAEPNQPLPDPGILPVITLPAERPRLAALAARRPEVCWERLLFSAKESVYKAWFPLTRRWLDFEQAELHLHPDGTFTAALQVPGPLINGTRHDTFPGHWLTHDGLLLTAITLPARG